MGFAWRSSSKALLQLHANLGCMYCTHAIVLYRWIKHEEGVKKQKITSELLNRIIDLCKYFGNDERITYKCTDLLSESLALTFIVDVDRSMQDI